MADYIGIVSKKADGLPSKIAFSLYLEEFYQVATTIIGTSQNALDAPFFPKCELLY